MKVLYISDRRGGGIVSHVKCLTDCLPLGVESYVIGVGGDEEFAGKSGHSIREWFQIRRVIKTFKPDVVHFNTIPLFMALYVKLFWRGGVVCSIHTPSNPRPRFSRRLVNWAVQPCYWLPVSDANWKRFKAYHPGVQGEVFYNPVRIGIRDQGSAIRDLKSNNQTIQQSNNSNSACGRHSSHFDRDSGASESDNTHRARIHPPEHPPTVRRSGNRRSRRRATFNPRPSFSGEDWALDRP